MSKLDDILMHVRCALSAAAIGILAAICTAVIPVRALRRRVRGKMRNWRHEVVGTIRMNCAVRRIQRRQGPLRVGFLVVLDSCFQLSRVYELMRKDPGFSPRIVVVPDVARGRAHQEKILKETSETLRAHYGDEAVLLPCVDGRWMDISKKFDVVMTMCPYSGMVPPLYTIPHLASRGVLVCYARYYTFIDSVWGGVADNMEELSSLWRFYAESEADCERLGSRQAALARHERIVAVGCPKLDTIASFEKKAFPRKRVILAPHHSVILKDKGYSVGNFLQYADLILGLPRKYPQIDWIFRPHPLLFSVLVQKGIWSQAEVDSYVRQMEGYPNCIYQKGGDYLETFVNSDAMIQDCGSFLPEYFYVDHPQLYVIRSEDHIKSQYGKGALKMLEACETASSSAQIYDFIERVVVRGLDGKRSARRAYFEEKLKRNFPHASEAVIEDLKKSLVR